MSACFFTEVKWKWATISTGMGDRSSALLSDGFAACVSKPKPFGLVSVSF